MLYKFGYLGDPTSPFYGSLWPQLQFNRWPVFSASVEWTVGVTEEK